MEGFQTDVSIEDGICIVKIQGNVSLKNAFALKELIIKQFDEGNKEIIIDFEGDVYLDSSGIGAIFNTQKYVTERQGSLKLRNLSRDVMTILRIANLDKHLDIIP
ncbi:STAS domain protein [Leptospira broomii serovar Hurstbridge str. 5399]|uniref:Anti-sigma factor antagonist n=1 Tax=Leptospira broomii serovar Hurstbridge str. 5399 TaxID=1049789 RepID=T0F5P1_9LEPT|nr:STAS domain-containing protein [Leptospira broomii]EQA43241.1 STAS domain protein [Leptospira broomii serovar Hurstbridge str. 5399]